MSTILDALKKSEQERKLNNVPTLADMPTPQESSSLPHMLLFAIALLLLVLIGFAVKLVLFPDVLKSSVYPPEQALAVESNANAAPEAAAEPIVESDIVESDIVVNVVSYSESPGKRFIMIDGKLIREGEFVRAGLKVEEIRQNDVILNLRGKQITRRP